MHINSKCTNKFYRSWHVFHLVFRFVSHHICKLHLLSTNTHLQFCFCSTGKKTGANMSFKAPILQFWKQYVLFVSHSSTPELAITKTEGVVFRLMNFWLMLVFAIPWRKKETHKIQVLANPAYFLCKTNYTIHANRHTDAEKHRACIHTFLYDGLLQNHHFGIELPEETWFCASHGLCTGLLSINLVNICCVWGMLTGMTLPKGFHDRLLCAAYCKHVVWLYYFTLFTGLCISIISWRLSMFARRLNWNTAQSCILRCVCVYVCVCAHLPHRTNLRCVLVLSLA